MFLSLKLIMKGLDFMKKVIAVLLAVVFVLSFAACSGNTNQTTTANGDTTATPVTNQKLRFVTGGESGTYYAFGTVLAQHATNNAGTEIVAVSGNGSQANIQELAENTAELAFCQSDVMAYAYEGKKIFEGTGAVTNFSTVAALYTEQVQIVTLDPEIKTVADLKGKNVSIGAAGSGVFFNAIDILGVYGLEEKDIKATYQSFADSADALKNGTIDAAFIVAGAPTTAVTDLSTVKAVNLVSLDDEHIKTLIESSPYYTECTISKDVYKTAEDIKTVGVGAVILAADTVSEEAVYAFVKDIFENAESQVTSHAKYSELSLEYASSITSVPYHAGAVKYFTEKGFEVKGK